MRTDTRKEYTERITLAVQAALKHLDRDPDPRTLADEAGFSRFHFGRVFMAATGETLSEFVRRLQLERAAWRLAHTRQSVAEVAFDASYESHEAFTRAFKSAYLVAPTEFRLRPTRHEIQSPNSVHWWPDGRRSLPEIVLGRDTPMEARLTTVPQWNLVALRHIGPYHEIGPKFGALWQWAQSHGVEIQGALGIWYDDPGATPAHELRSDACLIVADDFELPSRGEGDPDLRLTTVSPGEYAVGTHMGSYEGLGDAWARFCGQALPNLGREVADSPSFEVYVNDCTAVRIEEVRTDLYVRLLPERHDQT